MDISWIGYYNIQDGYGRFNSRFSSALRKLGIRVKGHHIGILDAPEWMQEQQGIGNAGLTITCCPPYMVKKIPGRQWLFTMTEGSRIPESWVEAINKAEVERVLVPCVHNLKAFRDSGVEQPISVVQGGTDPFEFPLLERRKFCLQDYRPYTFLCFADRGDRKGFPEAWDAFYKAFGGKTTGNQNVRLIIKGRMKDRSLISVMAGAKDSDLRVSYQEMDAESMVDVYAQADCLVLPSRSEGWGMIHREAASCGLPVITQKYSGLDDGNLERWALVLERGTIRPIPNDVATALGNWMVADVDDLAQKMKYCYHSPETAAAFGRNASQWIRQNQTWDDAAKILLSLIGITDALSVERTAVPAFI